MTTTEPNVLPKEYLWVEEIKGGKVLSDAEAGLLFAAVVLFLSTVAERNAQGTEYHPKAWAALAAAQSVFSTAGAEVLGEHGMLVRRVPAAEPPADGSEG